MDYNSLLMVSVSGDELTAAKQSMVENVFDWVGARYPNIKIETLENNLAAFVEIKKYDDQCKKCMSTQQCPSEDGNRMRGALAPDGVMNIWYAPCPHGYKRPRNQSSETSEPVKRWKKPT